MPRPRQRKQAGSHTKLLKGRVVADFGRHVLVEDEQCVVYPCAVRGRRLRVVCGDRVCWQPGLAGERGVVESLLPRNSEINRPDARGRAETVAANLDLLIVVCALAPPPDPELIDRYLVAAALMDAAAMIVCNKTELAVAPADKAVDGLMNEYAAIPYTVVRVSAKTGQGLQCLAGLLAGHTGILVGQSGVGKSSLLNALRPQTDAAVGALSSRSGEGTHTTRASRLFKLPGGGEIIDSPGVREYTPHLDSAEALVRGYVEFRQPMSDCRFRNCRHLNEPDCGVKTAVAEGRISARRYRSYRTLLLSPAFAGG